MLISYESLYWSTRTRKPLQEIMYRVSGRSLTFLFSQQWCHIWENGKLIYTNFQPETLTCPTTLNSFALKSPKKLTVICLLWLKLLQGIILTKNQNWAFQWGKNLGVDAFQDARASWSLAFWNASTPWWIFCMSDLFFYFEKQTILKLFHDCCKETCFILFV